MFYSETQLIITHSKAAYTPQMTRTPYIHPVQYTIIGTCSTKSI